MDLHLAKQNPTVHRLLIEAIANNKTILFTTEKPAVYEYICREGNRKWLIVGSDVVNTQERQILDDAV